MHEYKTMNTLPHSLTQAYHQNYCCIRNVYQVRFATEWGYTVRETITHTKREQSHPARDKDTYSTNGNSHIRTHAHGERRNYLIPKHVNPSDIHSHSMFMHRAQRWHVDPWHISCIVHILHVYIACSILLIFLCVWLFLQLLWAFFNKKQCTLVTVEKRNFDTLFPFRCSGHREP